MKKDLCEIVVLLDRSGSMQTIKSDMEGGFDRFMEEQRKMPGECRVSLFQFDTDYEAVYEGRQVADVPKCSLVPRGGTALVDALGRTINAVGDRFAKSPESDRPEKVVFLVITDGQENSSHEFTTQKVREMVKHQADAYRWQFVYLGADASAFAEAGKLGIAIPVQFSATAKGADRMYARTSAAVCSYRSGGDMAAMSMPKNIGEDEHS